MRLFLANPKLRLFCYQTNKINWTPMSELLDELTMSLYSTYLYLHRNLTILLSVYFHFQPFAAIDFWVTVQFLTTKRQHLL